MKLRWYGSEWCGGPNQLKRVPVYLRNTARFLDIQVVDIPTTICRKVDGYGAVQRLAPGLREIAGSTLLNATNNLVHVRLRLLIDYWTGVWLVVYISK